MTAFVFSTSMASLLYNAATVSIRYQYVKTSLQPQVQEVYKRDQFIFSSILLVESVNAFNLFSFYRIQRGKKGVDRSDLLLYQTCLGKG